MKAMVLAALLAAWGAASGPAAAGALSDAIMAPGLLAGVPAGPVFRYAHARHLPAHPAGTELPGANKGQPVPKPVADGALIVTAQPGDGAMQLVLTLDEAGKSRPVASFSAQGPNPVLLFFLENTVRVIAAETGGSPFYIRNRMRDALATAPLAGGAVVLHPFKEDPNAARMGDFATLTLALTFDPAQPGRLVELKADTAAGGQGYTETLKLIVAE